MFKRPPMIAGMLVLSMLMVAPTAAQSPSPTQSPLPMQTPPAEEMAAARELVVTMRMSDQLKTLVPMLVNNMKTSMLVGRSPEFVRDFEAVIPVLLTAFEQRYDELTDVLAGVYAANFTAQELRDMTDFYRSPTGQKVLRLLPTVAQQSMQAGQVYGHRMGEEIKQRMIEELRKKGHDI